MEINKQPCSTAILLKVEKRFITTTNSLRIRLDQETLNFWGTKALLNSSTKESSLSFRNTTSSTKSQISTTKQLLELIPFLRDLTLGGREGWSPLILEEA